MNGKISKPIVVHEETKKILDSLKVVPCETYDSVIERIGKEALKELRSRLYE